MLEHVEHVLSTWNGSNGPDDDVWTLPFVQPTSAERRRREGSEQVGMSKMASHSINPAGGLVPFFIRMLNDLELQE